MEQENRTVMDSFQREEQCRKAMKNVGKAIVMRILTAGLILLAFTRAELSPPFVGLMVLVILITLSALPILLREWSARKKELKEILDSEE